MTNLILNVNLNFIPLRGSHFFSAKKVTKNASGIEMFTFCGFNRITRFQFFCAPQSILSAIPAISYSKVIASITLFQ
jgi:hypothetical protein